MLIIRFLLLLFLKCGNSTFIMEMNKDFKDDFATLLANSYLSSDATVEESYKVWTELNTLLFSNIPQKLFRFRTCNADSIISFQEGTISTCIANAFKDRYDSLIYINKHGIEKNIQDFINGGGVDAIWDVFEKGYIYQIFESFFGKERMEELQNEDAKFSIEDKKKSFYSNLQNLQPFLDLRIKGYIDYMRNDRFTKIACFTEDVKSLYMWDLYADGYKGFALEYDFSKFHIQGCHTCLKNKDCDNVNKNFSNLFPVIYSDKRYDATTNVINIILREILQDMRVPNVLPPIDQLFWYKAYLYKDIKAYSHEREWRIITRCQSQQDADYATIPDLGCLKAIYYGPNMEKRYKKFIRIIAKERKVAEYDVFVDEYDSNYELKIVPLE